MKMTEVGEPQVTVSYEFDGRTYTERRLLFRKIYAMRELGLDVPPVTRTYTQVKTVRFE